MINVRRLFSRSEEPDRTFVDIFDHPDLRRMTLRELADLPVPRHWPEDTPRTSAAQGAADPNRSTGKIGR